MAGKGNALEGGYSSYASNSVDSVELTASMASLKGNIGTVFDVGDLSSNGEMPSATIYDSTLIAGNFTISDPTRVAEETRGDKIITYAVEEGDTLSGIGSKFDIEIQTVLWANNISNANFIKPGMRLKILPVDGVLHKVSNGDTVSGIAGEYDVDTEDIVAFNRLSDAGDLKIGQEIMVPEGKITPKYAASSRVTYKASTTLVSADGYFIHPVPASVRTQGLHGYRYNAVDFGAACGTPIRAVASGIVSDARYSGWNSGYGLMVQIDHPNGMQTLYAHASKVFVSAGQWVNQGDTIMLMGTTGQSTGCHLHFDIIGAKNPF
ncbi:MAG: LysM peptidoglycan-binding domain-containing M23 family metallopeptidase [Parcubacteria group bacterium]